MESTVYGYLKKIYSRTLRGRFYFYLRWRICPFEKMESLMPDKGVLLDIGCAEGVFANLLAATSTERRVIGIDCDSRKINIALTTTKDRSNITFINKDVFDMDFYEMDGVILSDFLHHISYEKQRKILELIYRKVKPSGVLLIKEVDRKCELRYFMSMCSELLIYSRVGFFKSKEEIAGELESIGFNVKTIIAHTSFGSTVLLVATK